MKTNHFISLILIALLFITVLSCQKENTNLPSEEITTELINNSGCKKTKSASLETDYTSSTSCISYMYDAENNTLLLKHINAGFNCCPEVIYCNSETTGDTIIISETEKAALCHCNCLFDLDIKLTSIEAKKYVIKMDEQYCGEQQHLIFEIDLGTAPSGEYCVERDVYPWGI